MLRSGKSRCGTTLVELLVVIALSSFVLVTSAVVLQTMYQVDSQIRDDVALYASLSRLSIRLREDVHAANGPHLASAANTQDAKLVLSTSDTQVTTYEILPGEITRTVQDEDQVIHRDSFRLGEDHPASWNVHDRDDVKLISVIIVAAPGVGADVVTNGSVTIDAALGLNHKSAGNGAP
jgi:type II secretory pathway pseudopilin PulG